MFLIENFKPIQPDKLAIITALHMIRNKFESSKEVRKREKKTSRPKIDRTAVHSVLFDSV